MRASPSWPAPPLGGLRRASPRERTNAACRWTGTAAAPSLDLAPGDSTMVTHIVPADSLASLGSGVYGDNVAVTMTTAVIGVWAGAVTLPLPSAP